MNTQHVDSKVVSVWRWQTAGLVFVLAVPVLAVATRGPAALQWGVFLLFTALATLLVWRAPAAYYRALLYGVDAHGITIDRGIWWRSRIALPRIRVQHSDVSQGPLERRYGVATLKLYTAGSRHTKIELSGLAHGDALALRDALIARGGDSGV